MKLVFVDDEQFNIDALKALCNKYFPGTEIAGTYTSSLKALKEIPDIKPDVLFLDIEMPHMSGFELLENLSNLSFDVIFVTAYDQYAIKAFQVNALDYILKPVSAEDFIKVMHKIKEKQLHRMTEDSLRQLLNSIQHKQPINKITLPTINGFEVITLADIIRVQGQHNYCDFHTDNKLVIRVSKNIGEYEEMLADNRFMRVHKSHIVNLDKVKRYVKGEGGQLLMTDDTWVDVSRNAKADLISRLKGL